MTMLRSQEHATRGSRAKSTFDTLREAQQRLRRKARKLEIEERSARTDSERIAKRLERLTVDEESAAISRAIARASGGD